MTLPIHYLYFSTQLCLEVDRSNNLKLRLLLSLLIVQMSLIDDAAVATTRRAPRFKHWMATVQNPDPATSCMDWLKVRMPDVRFVSWAYEQGKEPMDSSNPAYQEDDPGNYVGGSAGMLDSAYRPTRNQGLAYRPVGFLII